MGKIKTTSKDIRHNFNCIAIGYCDFQSLLQFESPVYYTCGVYGWNYDCYTFGDYAICTGYRNMPETVKTSKNKHELVRTYENKARTFYNEVCKVMDYNEIAVKLHEMILDFIKKVTEA